MAVWQRPRAEAWGVTDFMVSEPGSHMTLVVTIVYLHDKLDEYNLMSKLLSRHNRQHICRTGMGQFDKYVIIKLVRMIRCRKRSTTYHRNQKKWVLGIHRTIKVVYLRSVGT